MDREEWRVTVHWVPRAGHDLVNKQQQHSTILGILI